MAAAAAISTKPAVIMPRSPKRKISAPVKKLGAYIPIMCFECQKT